MRLAESGDPVVVDAAEFVEQFAVRHAVPEEAWGRLQQRTPDAVLLILGEHRIGGVSAFADILPDAEKIDRRGILEALPGLDHRAERTDLLPLEHPGVVFTPDRGLAPLHMRRPL